MPIITNTQARNLKPGMSPLSDASAPGLRLEPSARKGRGKWIFRFVSPVTGKRRDMGLGTYPEVSLQLARERSTAARILVAEGKDPIEERKVADTTLAEITAPGELTFEAAARQVHAQKAPGWKNAKHVDQWINTLQTYVFPSIGARTIDGLSPNDFAEVLRPIWLGKAETAQRVRQRCGEVMRWAWAQGMVSGDPLTVVDHLLPRQPGKRERVVHQPAMPWRDVPSFAAQVLTDGHDDLSRPLLEFVILTAARSGEVRHMTWSEVDLGVRIWSVPAERMKAKQSHRVPLSDRAVEILLQCEAKAAHPTLVFPSTTGRVLSDMVLTSFLRRHNAPSDQSGRWATAHGFRSSFRDWASEHGYSRDLAERALAHTIKNAAEAAYHRTDLLEQRRSMMEAWAAFVRGLVDADKVVQLRARS